VLQIDEMEKGLSGAGGSGGSDGGTSSRVLGYILTWMQEKREPVFVVATSNDLSRMPPELLRKGRFDEVFWLGFPTAEERQEILRIHLAKRSLEISTTEQRRVVDSTEGFTGAEIEALVAEANLAVLNEGRERVSIDDLLREAEATVPMLVTQWEKIGRDLERARAQGMRRASGSGAQVRLRDVVERYKSRSDLFLDDDGSPPESSESSESFNQALGTPYDGLSVNEGEGDDPFFDRFGF
jgi:SpoVK/Ycf46/Vps4 family AAA+-type ATPase